MIGFDHLMEQGQKRTLLVLLQIAFLTCATLFYRIVCKFPSPQK